MREKYQLNKDTRKVKDTPVCWSFTTTNRVQQPGNKCVDTYIGMPTIVEHNRICVDEGSKAKSDENHGSQKETKHQISTRVEKKNFWHGTFAEFSSLPIM